MILKKCGFPIFIILAMAIMFLFSCKNDKNPTDKENPQFYKLVEKAESFFTIQEFDSALVYYYKAKLACSSEELNRISYSLYYIAEIQKIQCDFSGSEESATESLKINPNYNQNFSFYNILGTNYLEQNDFKEAIKYYNLSLNDTKTKLEQCIIKNNIAYIYLESKHYSKAKAILESIVNHDSLVADEVNYAKVLDNLGFAYFKLNQPQAIGYLNKSLKIRDSLQNDSESIASYIHLSEYYQNTNPSLAKDFAQKAYNAATKIKSPDDRIEALKFLINSSDAKQIKELSQKQMTINDSITKVRQNSKNQFTKIKYDFSIASKESEKQKSQKQLYLSLFIFISVLSLVSFFAIRSRNKRKLLETTYETETRISKKLHDELANDVHNTIAFAENQNLENPENKETLLQNLDTIYTRTRNISSENRDVDTGENFIERLKSLISSYNSNERNVIVNIETINWSKINKETKIVIHRIIQELLVNMSKHSQCSVASIIIKTNTKNLLINYSDNGIGSDHLLKIKNGLQNAERRIESIKGSITFETALGKGFKAKIIIPK